MFGVGTTVFFPHMAYRVSCTVNMVLANFQKKYGARLNSTKTRPCCIHIEKLLQFVVSLYLFRDVSTPVMMFKSFPFFHVLVTTSI